MSIPYIRRLLWRWNDWRARERLYKADPELRTIDRALAAQRRKHGPCAGLLAKKSRIVHDLMKREVAF